MGAPKLGVVVEAPKLGVEAELNPPNPAGLAAVVVAAEVPNKDVAGDAVGAMLVVLVLAAPPKLKPLPAADEPPNEKPVELGGIADVAVTTSGLAAWPNRLLLEVDEAPPNENDEVGAAGLGASAD